ncbi:hypothetical protein HWV62_22628 [Athelia sp. TMB]|nr:hypothetical protein HWV62_22628 [Athelia sp. TMB]
MSNSNLGIYQLKCQCNNYPWGKKGSKSLAARYAATVPGTDFKIDEDINYAEMWMGTYPTLPSYVLKTGDNLQDVIDKNPEELVGAKVLKKFGTNLPFLPKILSFDKALALQVHPRKSLAKKLHSEDPDQYTDDNHKPEIAIALSEFEAFVGFRPLPSIQTLFLSVPTLTTFLPPAYHESSKELDEAGMKALVKTLLTLPEPTISRLITTLSSLSLPASPYEHISALAPRLASQYGATDPGTLLALLTMHYLVLPPGAAISIPADGIHAYLSGDIVECMARSDNVLNTGFCAAEERETDKFLESVVLEGREAHENVLEKTSAGAFVKGGGSGEDQERNWVLDPPFTEFSVIGTSLPPGEKESYHPIAGPSVLVVTQGGGAVRASEEEYEFKEGWVYFIGQGIEIEYEAGGDGLGVYRMFSQ